jgi:hypothetical protein
MPTSTTIDFLDGADDGFIVPGITRVNVRRSAPPSA